MRLISNDRSEGVLLLCAIWRCKSSVGFNARCWIFDASLRPSALRRRLNASTGDTGLVLFDRGDDERRRERHRRGMGREEAEERQRFAGQRPEPVSVGPQSQDAARKDRRYLV